MFCTYGKANIFNNKKLHTTLFKMHYWLVNHKPNKCQPILVQGLRRDIKINFCIYNIFGTVAQRISLAVDLKDPGSIPSQGDFFSLEFLLKRK